jgi:hypothetical protein
MGSVEYNESNTSQTVSESMLYGISQLEDVRGFSVFLKLCYEAGYFSSDELTGEK